MEFFRQLEQELQEDIQKILHHPFLERIRQGTLTENQLKYFAGQYHIYCEHFPRFLAAAAANIPDDETRMPIIENLWEEHGEGNLQKSHRILFYKFAAGLGLSVDELHLHAPLPSTRICCENLLNICRNEPFIESLGALGPGTEFFTNEEYSIIANGLRNYNFLTEDHLEFWTVHIELDEHHYSDMVATLLPWCGKAENRYLIKSGARRAIELEILFWEGLEDNLPT